MLLTMVLADEELLEERETRRMTDAGDNGEEGRVWNRGCAEDGGEECAGRVCEHGVEKRGERAIRRSRGSGTIEERGEKSSGS